MATFWTTKDILVLLMMMLQRKIAKTPKTCSLRFQPNRLAVNATEAQYTQHERSTLRKSNVHYERLVRRPNPFVRIDLEDEKRPTGRSKRNESIEEQHSTHKRPHLYRHHHSGAATACAAYYIRFIVFYSQPSINYNVLIQDTAVNLHIVMCSSRIF
mmetsp:Transcript_32221/g.67158  ORF Transcript_32221/g.67158 Transcript_32221/m.67158 type:complete len:157 (-) Transcript_32221:9-479(-)